MPHYFLVHDADRFLNVIRPTLSAAWRERRFEPCRNLCATLAPEVSAFHERYHAALGTPLVAMVAQGLPFDRQRWRLLVGELLLYSAAEIPEISIAANTFTCLLAPDHLGTAAENRTLFAPIQQAIFGTHDLTFGNACYQPERTGFNDVADVARLANYLTEVDPAAWSEADLHRLPELGTTDDRLEELELAHEWFAQLREFYARVCAGGQVVVCDAPAVPG